MAGHDDDDFDALLAKSSLGGSGARQLRERTPPSQARSVGKIIELRHHLHPDGDREAVQPPPKLPLSFEIFYLGHQEFFHDFAEIQLGSRQLAAQVVHHAFLEILGAWDQLLTQDGIEQQALEVLRRCVNGRALTRDLQAIRSQLEISSSDHGLYDAILELPERQFTVIVMRYLLSYTTQQIAHHTGLDVRTVDHHVRRAKERLRVQLRLPADTDKARKSAQ
ncbi:sigma-70 family RNA polymerase sigma factor [Streptomyces sp. NPDC059582]|uniref:sigma-70 family RNA polymerase sigma factor n=1 Tax=Streptomyces sp. NPDC059582 TaxID=3346875 RepID=UPI00369A4A45